MTVIRYTQTTKSTPSAVDQEAEADTEVLEVEADIPAKPLAILRHLSVEQPPIVIKQSQTTQRSAKLLAISKLLTVE
jgi:hypothetical protein